MTIVPRPQISYFLDADPIKARARKPEYPLDFLFKNRQSYFDLIALIGGISVMSPASIEEVERAVFAEAQQKLSFRTPLETRAPLELNGMESS
jgi:hypothetical protein